MVAEGKVQVASRPYTLAFDHSNAVLYEVVGAKGANLGKLSQAGFPVPPGFSVATDAYAEFVRLNGLGGTIEEVLCDLDFGDTDQLEKVSAKLREQIVGAPVPPAVVDAIASAYLALGPDTCVAVRSSGTAEDLAEASFAGQHDTYLAMRGPDAVLNAIQRCWASLWTARAIAYRKRNRIDHSQVGIAVVVQRMVDAEVAGVLFTGNPLTAATDEMVVNASWGLGESVVSGIVQPDEYILNRDTLTVKERRLGSKHVQILGAAATGDGTITEDVSDNDRNRFTLSDTELAALAALGGRVTEHYDGFPQDIEWGLAAGTFYLLQSRPITGVEFAWDADIEEWQQFPDNDHIWTRSLADMAWTGAVTPLFYSIRARGLTDALHHAATLWGLEQAHNMRAFTYYKGVPYYNTAIDEATYSTWLPKAFRPAALLNIAPPRAETFLNAPFRLGDFVRMQARCALLDRHHNGFFNWLKGLDDYVYAKIEEAEGLSDEELRNLSDRALVRYAEDRIGFESEYIRDVWTGFMIHIPIALSSLAYMVQHWYKGKNQQIMGDLFSGTEERTATAVENLSLWALASELRKSDELLAIFNEYADAGFFTALERSDVGRTWLAKYHEFLGANHHRGHADRDIYFARRSEDASIDYNFLKTLLTTDPTHDPETLERATNQRRESAVTDAVESIRATALGPVKAEAFKALHEYIMRCLAMRDNHRHWVDRSTFCLKRVFLEINRRLAERQAVASDRDFYFLGTQELYDLFLGRANLPLTKAKIDARAANFDAVNSREATRPMYLQNYRPAELTTAEDSDTDGALRGIGTSRGTATGRAKVVKDLKEIGGVQHGDILVCNSTDPGWTPVFLVVKGIVVETGGLLAHASCLAREYGLPAVQLASAMRRIPDGATITINGDTGEVAVEVDSSG